MDRRLLRADAAGGWFHHVHHPGLPVDSTEKGQPLVVLQHE